MRFVVDGYNVAHRLFGRDSRKATQEQLRDALLRRVRRFATRRRRVTVVFDGVPGPGARGVPRGTGDMEIVYAPSADDEIVDLVRRSDAPDRLRVVSRDREVTGRAVQLGARIVRVVDFLDWLDDVAGPDVEPGEPPEKYDP